MAKKYIVYIEEKLCKGTEIEAETIEEALDKARDMYNKQEIILTADDFGTGADIMAEEVGGGESTEWDEL